MAKVISAALSLLMSVASLSARNGSGVAVTAFFAVPFAGVGGVGNFGRGGRFGLSAAILSNPVTLSSVVLQISVALAQALAPLPELPVVG